MTRRRFFVESGASLLVPALMRRWGLTKSLLPQERERSYAEEMPDMLVAFLTRKLNGLAADWDQRRAQLQTASDLQQRNATVRQDVLRMVGAFPQKCPLRSSTVGSIDKEDYRIENVRFCSRPDFWVTGNLYVPTNRPGPFPAILSPCGHYPLARMVPQYQSAYISLVRSGFVVLAYDPIGQGERRQYWNPATGVTDVGGPVFEHSMIGQQLLLIGETLTGYMLWDGIRAIDYLLARAEVDGARIGCAGHSGGGTITKFLTVADDRIQCAAILEGGTANMWPDSSIGLGDVEQNLFPAARYGIDNVDLHVAIAPRPLLVGIEHEGAAFDEATRTVRARYRQLGVEEKFATSIANDPHAWTPALRVATTDWFSRWFYGRPGPTMAEVEDTCRPEELYCTPDGSLRYSGLGATLSSLTANRAAELAVGRTTGKPRADILKQQGEIRARVTSLLRFRGEIGPLNIRALGTVQREGYQVEHIEFLSEPGIFIPAWVFVPERRREGRAIVLYVSDQGMEADGMEFQAADSSGLQHGILDQLVREGHLVLAVDVRGIGKTRPHSTPSLSTEPFGQLFSFDTAMAYASWSMNKSLLGMRVIDVIRSIDYVFEREGKAQGDVHLVGKGAAALWCLYAAALDQRINHLICEDGLISYTSITESDRYLYGAAEFVPDILCHLDLPDVASAIAPRSLLLIAPMDAMLKPVDSSEALEVYRTTREAYATLGVEKSFRIENQDAGKNTARQLLEALALSESQTHKESVANGVVDSSRGTMPRESFSQQGAR